LVEGILEGADKVFAYL